MSSSPFTGHELRQFEGIPETIAATATQYTNLGAAMKRTADTLRDIAASQISQGTEKLKQDAESIESDLRQAGIRYEGTGTALAPYATALETARAWYTNNHQELESAETAYHSAVSDQQDALWIPAADADQQSEDLMDAANAVTAASEAREDLWRAFDSTFSAWEAAFDTAADGVADAIDAADNDDGFWGTIASALVYIGYAIIAIAVVALFVVSSPWSTILLAATLALSAIHLAGTIYMYANGKASQSDVLWSTFGLVTAGVGGLASRSIRLATAANGGEALVTASQTASKFPSFASGVRTASMPQLSGFTNPFSTLARGSEWAALNKWGTALADWAAKSGPRSATIADAWADAVLSTVPKIGGAGVTSVGSWVAGVAGGFYSSPINPFYYSFGRP
ncbi:apolipoprotein A1/A4/E family protein [Microbacterium aurugineum]|uniref:Apolipoprotein A1/A4/E family protein n=1 Tax=Microbacterium aurugineum TaxID=2851642 RepID=A0ABY4J0P9_9MICO|nr:apolipoprotein A1/A4/E family protein [Microbacterium aurugineum]UPL18572.1 apolipoprotein A1/A4/E family protein [Microbacterium aurugineum]